MEKEFMADGTNLTLLYFFIAKINIDKTINTKSHL